jgi:hypothetical protein
MLRAPCLLGEDILKRVRLAFPLCLVCAWLTGSGLLLSCKQSEGETCQVDGDCGSDLVCCKTPSAARGACYGKADARCGEAAAAPLPDASTGEGDQSDGG